ncbi:AAA domain-containing protein [Corynebacterium meitnerae]|uniref:AAA domain-containing protein n=1 Tax=Corynebacterium meitnerae TaxID=2913498 RepID=A0A9X3LUU4_9CORY|nr:AAA domain-containing protein [Corynebacterium meitnerae]MCZ9294642.1 AAA domain-containing protein [Corynebacterium meitnerae]
MADLQAQKEKPTRQISEYNRTGKWITLQSVKEVSDSTPLDVRFSHNLAHGLGGDDEDADTAANGALLEIKRPVVVPPPAVPDILESILGGVTDDPARRPVLGEVDSEGAPLSAEARVKGEAWLKKWDEWAIAARAHDLYQTLFDMQVKALQQADEFELVLGLGWLSWDLGPNETVDRPIFSLAVDIEMDKTTGAISISESGEPLKAELEALSADKMDDGRFIEELKDFLADFEGDPTDVEEFGELGVFTANTLTTQAQYEGKTTRLSSSGQPVLTWAPTLVLRPRQRVGLSSTFRSISQQIEEDGSVPAGLRPLVDTGYAAEATPSREPGALLSVDNEVFSPLPLNEKQLRVVSHVDSNAHTIVQGPPGTGKTHMAAALLSHLLAQGKRVLVTAEKERALYELRDKLPSEVRELAVSVIGSSSQEMADLRTAIETIQRKSSSFDQEESDRKIRNIEDNLRGLKERRTRILREWTAHLEAEQRPANLEGYSLPLPQLVQAVESDHEKFEWIEELGIVDHQRQFPLDQQQISTLLGGLNDVDLKAVPSYNKADTVNPRDLASVEEFSLALRQLNKAQEEQAELVDKIPQDILSTWDKLEKAGKARLEVTLDGLGDSLQELESFDAPWVETVGLKSSGREIEQWRVARETLLQKLEELQPPLDEIKDIQRFTVEGNIDSFIPMAQNLKTYLASGKALTVKADGTVKVPVFGGSTVKATLPFLNGVRVNGMPPTTAELVSKFLAYVSVFWELQSIQKSWPFIQIDETAPAGDLAFLKSDLAQFGRYLELLKELDSKLAAVGQQGFDPAPEKCAQLIEYAPLLRSVDSAKLALKSADTNYKKTCRTHLLGEAKAEKHPWMAELDAAIEKRSIEKYRNALERGFSYHSVGLKRRELDTLINELSAWSSKLASLILDDRSSDQWRPRLSQAEDARRWLAARAYVKKHAGVSRDDETSELTQIDDRIHSEVSSLAAERAWSSAVGAERIDGAMRATMQAYAQAVRRLGKGTGKHAEQHRRDVRRHLDRAREAVPVWIMPIYKVVEQFALEQNMFDVIVVDEASQAGIESVFLQFLAPKIVVVGDDRQVSPDGAGVKRDKLRKIARQYLYDFENIDAWVDPERSLFDDANMRYGGRIALDEHRRCVPEIIEFSNELVYRPSNIELKPVREVQKERLAPFRVTRTPNAFGEGKKTVNRAEADTLIARLLEVFEKPEYDGKSIGVISLLSTSDQADYIQKRLLTALPPQVWEERSLKVGAPADFQGAERDVVFLSMVSPVAQGARPSSLTGLKYEQRYNVAVSRAKDQVWLFHSIGVEDLHNQEDVRYKLLEYAYRVAETSPESRTSQVVSSDIRTEPFDSLFEQRVYNELVIRGYYVVPQFDAYGRRIDLVVQGDAGRLAVECDGDYWHSEEYALADQARQRELERLGWTFVRIFESDFYLDKNGEIQRVVDRLDELGIKPGYVDGVDLVTTDNVEVVDSVFGLADRIEDLSRGNDIEESEHSSVEEESPLSDESFNGGDYEGVDEHIDDPEPVQREEESTAPVEAKKTRKKSLEKYEAFEGWTESVKTAGKYEIDDGLRQIITVEGPIPEQLLFQRYVKAGGDSRVGDYARDVLTAGVARLITRGDIVKASEGGRIYRLPSQPDIRPRTRGPRTFDDITPAEWNVHLLNTEKTNPRAVGEELYKKTIQRIGFQRLTARMQNALEDIHWGRL